MFEDKELIEAIEGGQSGSVVELPDPVTVAEMRKPLKAKCKHQGRILIPEYLDKVKIVLELAKKKRLFPESFSDQILRAL